jgi:hypothetical protein
LRSANGLPVSLPHLRAFLTFRCAGFVLVIFLAGWCALGSRVSAQNLQPDNQSNIIRGIVVNALSNQPIGRALVYSLDNRYAMMTDGDGHFEFTLPKVEGGGGYNRTSFAARKPGFLDKRNGSGQIEVGPNSEGTILLVPEALVKGRVMLPAAEAVRGIEVELFFRQVQDGSFHWISKGSMRTNSSGEFRFAELQAGTYKVLTHEWMDNDTETTIPGGQLYGFPPVYYPSASDFAAASTD